MNPANSAEALQQLQQTQSTAQDPNAILATQRSQLGVQGAQDTVTGLRGAIDNTTRMLKQVAPSVMGRTGNSLVTSAQSGRIIQNEEAPISSTLADEGQKYSQASSDADKLESQAEQSASGIYKGQQDKQSYLQGLYDTLYQREQNTQAETDKQAAAAENQREAQASEATANAKVSGGTGGTSKAAAAKTPTSQQRAGGGYNFQSADGKTISARLYAQLTGTDFNTLLKTMAANGDNGAADVLKHGASSAAYKALTWD